MKSGESIKVLIDYDLFGHNLRGEIGVYVKQYTSRKKYLTYFPQFEEWAELPSGSFDQVSPNCPTKENLEFVARVKELGYT